MHLVRSSLFLYLCSWALGAPTTTLDPTTAIAATTTVEPDPAITTSLHRSTALGDILSVGLLPDSADVTPDAPPSALEKILASKKISLISKDKIHVRGKKSTSTPVQCFTVTEPFKQPYTVCNDASSVTGVAKFAGGGFGGIAIPNVAGGYGGGGAAYNAGFPHSQLSGSELHTFINGGTTAHHLSGGGGFTSPQIAVHPSPIGSNVGVVGGGYGFSGLPYVGLGPCNGGGGGPFALHTSVTLPPAPAAYGQISHILPHYKTMVEMSPDSFNVKGISAKQAAQMELVHQSQMAQAIEASRTPSGLQQMNFPPLPVINNILPTMQLPTGQSVRTVRPGVGVYPHSPDGGICGSIPLMMSCSPTVVRGNLIQAGHGYGGDLGYGYTGISGLDLGGYGDIALDGLSYGGGYQPAPWYAGIQGGYRTEEQQADSLPDISVQEDVQQKKSYRPLEQNTSTNSIQIKKTASGGKTDTTSNNDTPVTGKPSQ